MNHRTGRSVLAAALVVALTALPASAQLEENLGGLTGDQTEGYLGPLASGLSAAMNSGIFRSGNVPLVGLNFTLDVNAMIASFKDDDRTYMTPDIPGYGSTEAPTVIGDGQSVSQTNGSLTIHHPGGFDIDKFPIAVPQLTIGSVAGTRAILRYISVSLGDEEDDLGDFSLFGIGGQHSLSRYFPGLPVDLAAGAMWQTFSIGKDDIVKADALALNVTGSKSFGMVVSLEPYVGVGLDSFSMDAEYTADSGSETIKVEFDRANDFHGTVGVNVNLPIVKLNAEANVAAVNSVAFGAHFGI